MCETCEELKRRDSGYAGYVPIPLWNGKEWEPTCFVLGEKPMCWPEGFSTNTMPTPLYQLGDIVTFPWTGEKPWKGYVKRIKLRGGSYYSYEGTPLEVCTFRYRRPFMTYTIYAKGHGRWVPEHKIIEKVGVAKGFFH
ncbi:MAG: hypothetical protein GWN93_05995 [Deltaproteobacteria bacterium]|nr:hypothetical protein [Deltaproteobacteria bacterium]